MDRNTRPLDYASRNVSGQRVSRSAVVSLPLAIVSCPFVVAWFLPYDRGADTPGWLAGNYRVLVALMVMPLIASVFAFVALRRVLSSNGRLTGLGLAGWGLGIALFWLCGAGCVTLTAREQHVPVGKAGMERLPGHPGRAAEEPEGEAALVLQSRSDGRM